jgi:hypothetical protein
VLVSVTVGAGDVGVTEVVGVGVSVDVGVTEAVGVGDALVGLGAALVWLTRAIVGDDATDGLAVVDASVEARPGCAGFGADAVLVVGALLAGAGASTSGAAAGGLNTWTMAPPAGSGKVGQRYGLEARLTAVTAAAANAPTPIRRDVGMVRRHATRRRQADESAGGSGNLSLLTISCQTGPA